MGGLSSDEFQELRKNKIAFKQFIQKMNIEEAFEKFRRRYMANPTTAIVLEQPKFHVVPTPTLSKSANYSVPPIENCCRKIEIELNEAFETTTAKCTKDKSLGVLTSNFHSKVREYEYHLNLHMNLICC